MYKRKRMVNVLLRFGMISSSTAIAVPLPRGGRLSRKPHVEKRSLQNRISASSHMIQRRRQISLRHSPTSLRMTRGVCGGSKPPPYGQRRRFRKSHVEKRSLQNRISASSHIIQGRSLIAPPQVAKPNCPTAGGEA